MEHLSLDSVRLNGNLGASLTPPGLPLLMTRPDFNLVIIGGAILLSG